MTKQRRIQSVSRSWERSRRAEIQRRRSSCLHGYSACRPRQAQSPARPATRYPRSSCTQKPPGPAPIGLLQESVDADEALRFVQPSRKDHLTDGVNPHSQSTPITPKCRRLGSEAVLEKQLVNLKRLWQIRLRIGVPSCKTEAGTEKEKEKKKRIAISGGL